MTPSSTSSNLKTVKKMGMLALVRLAKMMMMAMGEHPGRFDPLVINRQGAKNDGAIGKFRYLLVRTIVRWLDQNCLS